MPLSPKVRVSRSVPSRVRMAAFVLIFTLIESAVRGTLPPPVVAAGPCDSPANPIVAENCLTGTPQSTWDVSGAGDPSIQGFATDISVNVGDTVSFKIDTDSSAYHIDIYRLGYYGGDGARLVTTIAPSATLPQTQPACLFDTTDHRNLVDCGNWGVSASWAVPSAAVSGIYLARPSRDDAGHVGEASHIVFIVRNDASHSDILLQTSDTTWQAYNRYGGYSLYDGGSGSLDGAHAHAVSYNRPFTTRDAPTEDWLFNAEYPMLRFLEQNGYDVSYFTDMDTDRHGSELLNHKVFISSGHDEYWSAGQRANVEAARDGGVNLAFFSGNESYWKTRWEPSTDGSSTPYRTLVSYKEGSAAGSEHYNCQGNYQCDPDPVQWTGLWREGCADQNPGSTDGCKPENALSGQISWNGTVGTLSVPAEYARLRFWRDTSVAGLSSGSVTLAQDTLGYEWDPEQPAYASTYPAGRILLSQTDAAGLTHHMSLYRAPSGAIVFGAGTVQWSWGLDPVHDRGSAPANADMQQATVNVLADMGAQPATLMTGLTATTASTDTTAPTTTITSPSDGSTISGATTVTGTATDTGGSVGTVEVSTDGGTTWHPAQGRDTWSYAFTPSAIGSLTIMARAADDSLNIGASDSVTVTAQPRTCPCSIWDSSAAPAETNLNDNTGELGGIEVGVKFQAAESGFITGLRFYWAPGDAGTHEGHLWSATGTQLASVSFPTPSTSGWQEVAFDAPVAIDAGTTYVASQHSSLGYYSDTVNDLSTAFANPPLTALADGTDGPNGVYAYGSSAFPTSTFSASNYWVDVVFATDVGPDMTPPTVVSTSPSNGATGVSVSAPISVRFSEPIYEPTISGSTFQLVDDASQVVPATVTYNSGSRTATLTPTSSLAYSSAFTATVTGGSGGVKDLAGNALAGDHSWSFTTSAPPPPPPTDGPGGPILVITSAANSFTTYYSEILRAEGLNEFATADISTVDATLLGQYEVAILGDLPLSAANVTTLSDWVNAGGNLIAMHPDKQLAGLLGISDASSTLSNGYLLVDTSQSPGAGIVNQTMQFHGTADRYTLSGATGVATLYADASTATVNPAVTFETVGTNGGHAAAFTYDLARSVVYTRQGNPAWSGDERDGVAPIRSDDLFYGAKTGDVQPDWVDLNKVAIPQADEQQRLLANLIEKMEFDKHPLPRFWYLPRDDRAVVVMTGDDHGNGGTVGRFDTYLADSTSGCSVADWECIRSSSYIYPGTNVTDTQAATYTADGFEIGVHISTNCGDWTPASLEDDYATQLAQLAAQLPSIPPQDSNRTHCIAWSDYATQPSVELNHGIRLDTNYYYWPASWIQDRPGFFTGSGMPMRFANLDGSMIDVYQAVSQMTDESGQTFPFTIDTLLNRALGAEGYYGVFTANMHTDSASSGGSDAIIASAQSRGVPVVSGRQMLTWLDGRNGSSFGNLAWNGNTLTFTIAVGAGANGLRAMLPTTSAAGALTGITLGGIPVSYATQTIKGIDYAFFNAAAGSYEATYAVDTTAPIISAVNAAPGDDGTAAITWTTDEPSDSQVAYGMSDTNLDLAAGDGTLVTSHAVTVTGLDPNTTYYFRVSSTDAADNTATSPEEPAPASSFSTPSASVRDTTTADFAAGTPAGTYVSDTADGEVTLAPTVGAEFDGSTVPSGWTATPWSGGGSATVAGGTVTLDEDLLTNDTFVSAGHSVSFAATFSAANQHAGFANDFNSGDWAIFSTGQTGDQLYARSLVGGNQTNTSLGVGYLNGPHTYRIDWMSSGATFFIDGVQVASHVVTFATSLRPAASDSANGAGALAIDWMRMSPYATSATFTSRVLDAGTQVDWGTLNSATQVPTGASAPTFMVRVGNTPTPGAGWTSFTSVGNGGDVPGSSQYLQYQVSLGTSDVAVTPEVDSVSIGYVSSSDTTPPTIVSRAPDIGEVDVLVGTSVVVTFSEPIDASTVTGSTLRLRAQGGGSDVSATISTSGAQVTLDPISDLDPSTVYTVTVGGTIADPSGNQLGADDSWTFTTSAPILSLIDTTAADFGAGDTGASTYVSETADGEVTLAPTVGAEFDGSSLPAGWAARGAPWNTGGSASVGGGLLTLDGTMAGTSSTFGPGRSIEFVATFQAQGYQHVGFIGDFDFNAPYAIVSTTSDGSDVYALASVGNAVSLGAGLLGSPHRYRIDWTASGFDYYVDGVFKTTLAFAPASAMLVGASDLTVGTPLTVDWLHLTPYPASGTFTSRVLDSGGTATWRNLDYVSTSPAGTSLSLQVRTGDTPMPDDGTWSAFVPLTNGSDIPGESRYVQYQAAFTSTDANLTPTLASVSISYTLAPDAEPPTIVGQSPIPGATGVSRSSNVSATFSEPIDQATLTGTSFTLTQQGAGSPVAATVSYNSATETATLDPSADLAPGAVYTARVTTAVTDAAGNHLAADSTWSFTVQAGAFTDTTRADFAGGTPAGTYVSQIADGEVILAPMVGEEFSGGPGLPSGWSSIPWTGGTATVASGGLTVDGTLAATDTYYSAGRSIEFVGTFGAAGFQHVGFGQSLASLSESWAMFSTLNTTSSLYARTDNNGTQVDYLIPGTWIGSPHRFRIDWTASSVVFSIDGAAVDTQNVAIGAQMRPVVSDYNSGGPVVSVDWLRMTPYASSGSFISRIFDAGEQMSWIGLSWTADLPGGTAMTISARTGDTSTPDDGTWSAFRAITSSGDPVGAASRYVQYQAILSTTDPDQTPALRDVTLTYVVPVLDHLVLSPASASIAAGDSQTYTAEGFDAYGNDLGEVTAATTFSITPDGGCSGATCTASTAGPHTVTGTDGTVSADAALTVTAAELRSLAVSPATASIPAGDSQQFTATGTYSDGSTADLSADASWTSDATSVATVDASGLASGLAVGDATISASYGGFSADAALTVTAAELRSLAVSPATASIPAGDSQQFTATGTYSDGSTADLSADASWTSDATSVATVDASGLASGLAVGDATISASYGGFSADAALTVTAAELRSLAVSPATASIPAGDSQQFTATGTYSDGSTADLSADASWTSDATSVATVDASGLASGLAVGDATISASYGGFSADAALTVTAAELRSLAVSPATASIPAGDSQQFTATGTYSDGSTADLSADASWTSDATSVATVDASGLASGLAVGDATISASYGGFSADAALTVTAAELRSLAVSPATASIPAGDSQQFTATGTYSDGSTADLSADASWTSDATSVATVDASGLASGLAVGDATISASYGGFSADAALTVTAAELRSLAVSPATASIPAGDSQQFTATGTYSDGSTADLSADASWTSDATSVATVDASGLASGLAVGDATISASYGGFSADAALTVTAAELRSLAVSPATASIPAGDSQQFTATGTYSDGSTADLSADASWTSDATSVATVDASGLASGLAVGDATISASYGGFSADAALTVTAAELRSLAVSPATASIPAGDSQQFTATGTYSDGSTADLSADASWTSDATSVATVDASGLASGLAVGDATISASYGGFSADAALTVTAAELRSLAVSPATASIPAGDSQQFTATGTYSDGSTADLSADASWTSDATSVATVDASGLASGLAVGDATISASYGGFSADAALTVTADNQPPTASDDSYSTPEDTSLSVVAPGVLQNDSDPEGDSLNAVVQGTTSHGTLTLNSDGSFSYVPTAGYFGPDTFTYVANDGANDSNVATVTIDVVQDVTPPDQPSGLQATLDTIAVHLTWAANSESDLAGYNVYWSSSESGTFTKLNTALLTSPAYDDQTATIGQESFYRVTAVDVHANESAAAATSVNRLIGFRSSSSANNKRNASLVIVRPQGLQAGDAMVAGITVSGTPTVTAPAGWTLVRNDSRSSTLRQVVYVKIAGSSEPASYTWTFSSSAGAAGEISAYIGVDQTTPVDASAGQSSASSTSISVPSVTTTSDGDLLVALFGIATNATITPPSAMLAQASATATAGKDKVASELADQIAGPAGATQARTASTSAPAINIGQLVALRAATNTPPPPADTEPPSQPGAPVATAISSSQIDLSWAPSTDNVRVDHYTVYRTNVTASGTATNVGTASVAHFSDQSVSAETTYTYYVVAADPSGNDSLPSETSNAVTTPPSLPPPAQGITFVGAAYVTGRGGSLVITLPSGAAPGDLLVAAITTTDSPGIVVPPSWHLVNVDTDGGSLTQAIYWHVLTSADSASFAWSFSKSVTSVGALQAYSGVDVSNPIDAFAAGHGTGNHLVAPSISSGVADEMLVTFFGMATNTSITSPPGMTRRGELSGTGPVKLTAEGCDQVIANAGNTGTRAATAGKSADWIAHSLLLRIASS